MDKTSQSKIYVGRNYHRKIVIILGLDGEISRCNVNINLQYKFT